MARFKKFLRRALYPHTAVFLPVTALAAFSLVYVFAHGLDAHPAAYAVYVLSFYALCAVCANAVRLAKNIKKYLHQNAYTERYLSDAELRARISLYAGTLINIGYAIFKLAAGIRYSSLWFGAAAVYYMMLSLIRFLLIRADRLCVKPAENRYRRGWKSYRLCGVLLLLLNIAISGMAFQMIWQNKGYAYPGFIIYASAAYTFYRLTVALAKIFSGKIANPILLSAKALDLSMALMAMFSLQTAMFASFGQDMTAESRRWMNALTGGAVCFAVLCIALFMLIKSTKKLRANKTEISLDPRAGSRSV